MPPKAATVTTTVTPISERLELAKAISNISTKGDAFVNAMENFKNFTKDALVKLDLDIDTKRLELSDLQKQIDHKIVNGRIDIQVSLREFKRESAVEMLKEMGETVIGDKELAALRQELQELRGNYDSAINAVKKEEAERREKAIGQATRNMELQHKATNATILALSEQQQREIGNLKGTINDLRQEISAQRDLTRSVAEASSGRSQGGGGYMPQHQQGGSSSRG